MNNTHKRVGLTADKAEDKALNRSHSQKMCYVNDELNSSSRDVATIFHSPYKNGKRNENYINPTFISSNIFYCQQQTKKQLAPKHNLIYNKNQRSKNDLYHKRIQRQDYIVNTIHQVAAHEISTRKQPQKVNDESYLNQQIGRLSSRSGFKEQNNETMQRELDTLIVHRQKQQKKHQQMVQKMNLCAYQLQNNRSAEQVEQAISSIKSHNTKWQNYYKQNKNKNNLREWIDSSNKIKKLKKEQQNKLNNTNNTNNSNNSNSNNKNINKMMLTKQQLNLIKYMECKKHNDLLGNILRQQIKQGQNKKLKQKKQRIQLY